MNRPTLLGLLAILLWSVTVGLARSLSERTGPLAAGAAVYLVGGALCLVGRRLRARPPIDRRALLRGCLFVGYLLAFYLAIGLAQDRAEVLAVGLANYFWPSLTILFSLPLLGKRAGRWLAPGTLLAVLGVALVVAEGAGVSPRDLLAARGAAALPAGLALVGAVLWALYSNLTSRWAEGRSGSDVALFMLATGALFLALTALRPTGGTWTARAAAEALVLGLATGAGYACWEEAMTRGDVTLVAAASYATPLLSTLFSCVYLGIVPDARLWLGCAFVVAGSLLSWVSVR